MHLSEHTAPIRLPGGLLCDDTLEREVRFRLITGGVEMSIAEAMNRIEDTPTFVTGVLTQAVHSIGDRLSTEGAIWHLCIADRQYLMMRLAGLLHQRFRWLTFTCNDCGLPFDLRIDRENIPVKEAAAGFPHATVQLAGQVVRLHVPTGSDQQQISGMATERAVRGLVSSCIESIDGGTSQESFVDGLTPTEIEQIDQALEQISPAVATGIQTDCPICHETQIVHLDPYQGEGSGIDGLYDEVHQLALHYHWDEETILNLPRFRRRRYLGLIERSLGMVG